MLLRATNSKPHLGHIHWGFEPWLGDKPRTNASIWGLALVAPRPGGHSTDTSFASEPGCGLTLALLHVPGLCMLLPLAMCALEC